MQGRSRIARGRENLDQMRERWRRKNQEAAESLSRAGMLSGSMTVQAAASEEEVDRIQENLKAYKRAESGAEGPLGDATDRRRR